MYRNLNEFVLLFILFVIFIYARQQEINDFLLYSVMKIYLIIIFKPEPEVVLH